jgi:hypothetical protein
MILKINNWFGRLGNNIIQLRNIILIAIYYGFNIEIPGHPFFTTKFIKINNDTNNDIYIDNEGSNFFYSHKIKKFDVKCFNENIDAMKKILQDMCVFKIPPENPNFDNILTIHIRGGDLFSINPPHQYIPPPYEYYKNIIDENNYKKIIIISEDIKNPIIIKLQKIYPNILFQINNLTQDVEIILSSKNIVQSVGTFIPSLLLLSKNIRNIYSPSYIQMNETKHYFENINLIEKEYNNYNKIMNKWCNTNEQNNLLLNFKTECS